MRFPNFGDGGVHTLLRSAVHDDRRTFGRECARRRETDSSAGTRHQCFFARELQIHERLLPTAARSNFAALFFRYRRRPVSQDSIFRTGLQTAPLALLANFCARNYTETSAG